MGNRENRWMQDVNHCVSKALVKENPPKTLFVLEDLTNVRTATERVLAFFLLASIVNGVLIFVWGTEPFMKVITGFSFLAILIAFYYGLNGYRKSAATAYKAYFIIFAIILILGSVNGGTVVFSGGRRAIVSIVLTMLSFACYFCLIVAENLGERKSMTLAWIVVIVYGISIAMTLIRTPGIIRGGTIADTILSFRAGTNFVLSLVALVMTKAKYMDKELRGTK